MNDTATRGTMKRHGAWVRYGDPVAPEQISFAIANYQVAILQPWETDAARALKQARPDMTVLCYKCLSSTREYEPGPIYSSGLGYREADVMGEHVFAHRPSGTRIEWNTYPGHWQMAVWDDEYRTRWCRNVVKELAGSAWDGVMADNDVYDDYYGLQPPLDGGRHMADIRHAVDEFVPLAGSALNDIGKLLVPNIAESRRDPGRWERHSAYGGGFEEVWLAHGADDYFSTETVLAQASQAQGPGITIMRVASDGTNEHRNFTYGLAAFWIFGGGKGTAFTATGHDQYSVTPFIPQLNWDLGEPLEEIRRRGNGRSRRFRNGWAAINLNTRRRARVKFSVPQGLYCITGRPAPDRVSLMPHEGLLYVCKT
ncbi:MAG: putative glycoside hydrolase [Pseudonocardiaceae bacterium]